MLTTTITTAFFAFSAISGVAAHSAHDLRGLKMIRQDANAPFSAAKFPDVQKALEGNGRFQKNRDAAALQSLVDNGQKPPFMMFSCSDSRAPEATIFDSQPGTFFMERNIANQYKPGDENAQSVMAYGIAVLGVQHVVVLGHYGCGGVAASIATAPKTKIDVATHVVQTWIGDIRQLYLQSNRTEIADMRTKNLAVEAEGGTVPEPEIKDPGFRALVEENVKLGVKRISESSVIRNLHERLAAEAPTETPTETPTGAPTGAPTEGAVEKKEKRAAEEGAPVKPVFVHGWVYDLESGTVTDLNVSTGPKGFENIVPNPTEETKPGETKSEEPATATGTESASEGASESASASASEGASETASATASATEGPAATESAPAPEQKVETIDASAVSTPPQPAVKELGHTTKPVKRSDVLARLKRSLPQQGGHSKRFSRHT